MVHEIVTHISLDSFRERSDGKKVILLYPWTTYRNLFLTHFVTNNPSGLLYYRISQDSLRAWLTAMVDEFEQTLGGFGQQLRGVLKSGKPAELGEALAADLVLIARSANRSSCLWTNWIVSPLILPSINSSLP